MTQRELVERMLDADFESRNAGKWQNCDPTTQKRFLEGMSSSLKVAVEEMLSEATVEESEKFQEDYMAVDLNTVVMDRQHALTELLGRRMAKFLSPPKPPTLADRVMPILDKWFTQHTEETQRKVAEEIASLMKKEES